MTVVLRTEKNGAELGRRVVPLRSAAAQTVTVPAKELGGRERFTLLLMFNKTGGTLKAMGGGLYLVEASQDRVVIRRGGQED